VFCSGAAALIYEVLWAHDWALLCGSTAIGTAIVLAAYFTGLATGAAAVASAPVRARTLRLYATLEAAVAVAILGYVAIRPALPGIVASLELPGGRTLLAFGVLIVPTALLGATLPAAARALAPDDPASAGRLYAWNTLGGAAGALAAGLVGIRTVGVHGTFLAAVLVDVAVAVAAFALGGVTPARREPRHATAAPRPALAAILVATTGFVGLADEVLWTRGLSGVLSNSVYSVTLVLAATLLGLVVGAATGARRVEGATPIQDRLGLAFALLTIATVGTLLVMHRVGPASVRLATGLGVAGPTGGLAVEATLAALVAFAPAVCLGAIVPLAFALAGTSVPSRTMGRILAADTAAGIAGALGAAFVLLPRLGLGGGTLVTAAVPAIVATALPGGRLRRALPVVVIAVAAVGARGLRVTWRDAGTDRVLFYRDGAGATVSVTADASGAKRLRINGQYSLGGTAGLLLEEREAHLPLLLHRAPSRVLALGVGTGDTAGAALVHPGIHVDGVELVPEALAGAAWFARENRGVLESPRARLVVDDARSHLLTTPETYDVILSDLFLPWTAGTAALYSLDFYRLGLAHLRPGGLYCQWLPLHQLGVADLETIVATFAAAFPYVQVWVAYHRAATPLAALVGSATPVAVDAAAIGERMRDPTLAPALRAAGLVDPADVAVLYVTDASHVRAATAGAPLITDDRPQLEFTAPAAYFHQQTLGRAALAWVAARLDPADGPIAGAPASFALRAALLQASLALLEGDGPSELAAYLDALTIAPELSTARAALAAIAAERERAGDTRLARRIAERLDAGHAR